MRPAAEAGIIYDIGYQRYEGARLGRGYAFRTLFTHSLRTAWGLGRGGKALAVPFGILGIIVFPALIQVLVDTLSAGEAKLIGYADYFNFVQGIVVLFCAAQAPELVSTDQHNRVLPLYFSRSLRRADYAGAKLLAMIAALWLLVLTPMVVLFLGRISAAPDVGAAFRAERLSILPALGATVAIAVVMGSISIALASLTQRRALGSAAIFGMVVLTSAISGIMMKGGGRTYAALLSPIRVLGGVIRALFKVPPDAPRPGAVPVIPLAGGTYTAVALGLALVASLALFARYARVRA